MNLSERQQTILKRLRDEGGVISSNLLTDYFDVSVQTIRKDLNELSDLGLVKRVHGGITLPVQSQNLPFQNRQIINLQEKEQIAQSIARDIPEGASIFLGIGTTLEKIAEALLSHPGLTVITNNLNAALILCQNERITTFLAGGRLRASDQDTTGEETTAFLRKFHVNYGIFGVGGIGETGTLLDFSPEESNISRSIMENCEKRLLVADRNKYMRSAPVRTGSINEIDRFYIDTIPENLKAICDEGGVKIVECAGKGEGQ
ncbi:DeoR/GlpR family DNA-binding transcription regulator [Curvivirga sp.]|uniref:DeoR/GlpR family DNA-binding transcription regulator n=1 Tax=Curvivirga sp. TaxID=2856848 RepID=UPI003B5C51FE